MIGGACSGIPPEGRAPGQAERGVSKVYGEGRESLQQQMTFKQVTRGSTMNDIFPSFQLQQNSVISHCLCVQPTPHSLH